MCYCLMVVCVVISCLHCYLLTIHLLLTFLIMRMNDNMNIVAVTKTNLLYLYDVEVVSGLTCNMPLLEVVHALIKFAHA